MSRLINRQVQIPNGFRYLQPETGWQPRRFSSFESIVQGLISHRKGNAALLAKKYSVDYHTVASEVEQFNVKLCQAHGWASYITSEGGGAGYGGPPSRPPSQPVSPEEVAVAGNAVKKIWSGVRTLNDWIDSGEPGVEQAEAERRAAICVACPLNGTGGLESWFTKPAAAAIKRQFERLESRKLSTSQDGKLNVCKACYCPMKLKVWTPMSFIKANLADGVVDDLRKGRNCWIIAGL